MGKRYGLLPSEVIGMEMGPKAFSVNIWAMNAGIGRERIEQMKVNQRGNRQSPRRRPSGTRR